MIGCYDNHFMMPLDCNECTFKTECSIYNELAKAREALNIARSLIIRHHACHVVQRAGAFCPVCHRDDGTEPEMDQIYDALNEAAEGRKEMRDERTQP